jgi:hypothetical protein
MSGKLKRFKIINVSLALFLAICLALVSVQIVFAGLRVAGAKIIAEITPGSELTHIMNVGNTTDESMDIAIEVSGYGTSATQNFIVLSPQEDTSQYSARTFFSVSPSSFHLEPGESCDVTFYGKVPDDAVNGGRYAIIFIHTQPTGQDTATITAVAARVLLTIKSSDLVHTSEIISVETKPKQPLDLLVTIANKGNHHYNPKISGTLKKANETLASALTIENWPVIPGYPRQFSLSFTGSFTNSVPAGIYTADITVEDEAGNLTAEYSYSLEVEEPYTPPSPQAEVIVLPTTASDLKTNDGKISINFPKGAVTGQVTVSLQSYPVEQSPISPTGYQTATTCFRVDGLTGLLAKEATIKVQYSPADLEKAGGDASRLKLARWDEGDNQWSILKTTVDKNNMTLTATTDRFSIWSVMVAPPVKINLPLIIGGSIGGVIIVCLAVIYIIKRRK